MPETLGAVLTRCCTHVIPYGILFTSASDVGIHLIDHHFSFRLIADTGGHQYAANKTLIPTGRVTTRVPLKGIDGFVGGATKVTFAPRHISPIRRDISLNGSKVSQRLVHDFTLRVYRVSIRTRFGNCHPEHENQNYVC
ncbi:MAG: hypothetical protein Kow0060_06840 [Methylohalobius crimeensis]